MIVNPVYCMNSYLTYRSIINKEYGFSESLPTWFWNMFSERISVCTSEELGVQLKNKIDECLQDGPVALMLSGGMDSAILARYLPEGTQTYTLHCVANSGIDEAPRISRTANRLRYFRS